MTQDNKDNVYYAWIPILTNDLNFDYFIKELGRDRHRITGDEARTFDKKLSKSNGIYYNRDTHEDVENKKFRAVVSINDKKILDHIFILGKTGNLEAHAVCGIDNKGLITLKLEYPDERYAWKEHEMIEQFYIIARDLYHTHTHHKEHEDLLLNPVIAKNKKDAIGKILDQYDEKIIKYHKRIRPSIRPHEKFDFATKLIVAAKSEMTYASRFVNLFKENIENPEARLFVFSNALQSINILANEIESAYTARLNTETVKLTHLITGLTLAIVALTVSISIDAIFGISEHTIAIVTEHIKTQIILDIVALIIKFISILWIFSCLLILMAVFYKLRGWIKEVTEKIL